MDNNRVQRIIEVLESACARKRMYLSEVTVSSTMNFLGGFSVAAGIFGHQPSVEIMKKAWEGRGWEFLATGPLAEMKSKGMTEDEIIEELFQLEIQTWKLVDNH